MHLVFRAALLGLLTCLVSAAAQAGVETVEVSQEQHLRRVEGIVRDPRGDAIPQVEVQLRARGSQKVLKSTWSRIDGHFWFFHVSPGEYDLYLQANGLNPMLYHLKIDRNGRNELLIVKMDLAT
jgi:hypothetical protein